MSPDPAELSLVDRWQHDFPLVDKPFEVVGRSAALNERETIGIFRRLREIGVISRIGAVVRPNTIGASTLAALQVPPERLEEVAAIVSREPLVTHNYERTHVLNLWFVIAGADAKAIAANHREYQAADPAGGDRSANAPGLPSRARLSARRRAPGQTGGDRPARLLPP